MNIIKTGISGVSIINPSAFYDQRGSFVKNFNYSEFVKNGLETDFKESYYSVSKKGVIRGMHFQQPPAEHAKLVYVVKGTIVDVVLDIRKNSSTYGVCIHEALSDSNFKAMYISKGCAHGFKTISDEAVVVYLQTSEYNPGCDIGIRWDSINFDWELSDPVISDRDAGLPLFSDYQSPF